MLYRVTVTDNVNGVAGSSWWPSRREAKRRAAAVRKQAESDDDIDIDIDAFYVPKTKGELLALLRRVAGESAR